MRHETARDLLAVRGKPPFPLAIFEEDDASQAMPPALMREQTVCWGEHRAMVRQRLGRKILAPRSLLLGGGVPETGCWCTVALPPDLAALVGPESATSRASITVPAPILRSGFWHRPAGASAADWLGAGGHPGAEGGAPGRRAGAERLYQGVSRGRPRGASRPPGAPGTPRVSACWRYPRRGAPGALRAGAWAVAGRDTGRTEPAGRVPESGGSPRHHDGHRPMLFSDHGGLGGTRTAPHTGTHPRRACECTPAWTSWRPAASDGCRDVCPSGPALSGSDELGAEYLSAPRDCPSHVLALLSGTTPLEGGGATWLCMTLFRLLCRW